MNSMDLVNAYFTMIKRATFASEGANDLEMLARSAELRLDRPQAAAAMVLAEACRRRHGRRMAAAARLRDALVRS